MLFFRQTLLSVCLVVLCAAAFAQPVAGPNSVSIDEDDPPFTFSVLNNDDDPSSFDIDPATVDLDPATAGIDQGPMAVTGGTISVDNLGEVTFSPNPNYNGTFVVPYTVSNDESPVQVSPPADITITVTSVNDDPAIDPVGPITITEDAVGGTGTITLVIADIETPIGMLTLSAASDNTALVDAGSFAFSGNELIITPLQNAFGTANITITVEDVDGGENETILALTVTSANDVPQADDDNASTNEDTPVTVSVIANDTDIDGTIAAATVDLVPGTPAVDPTASDAAGSWATNGSGGITYTPTANYTGPASIGYRVTDNSGAPSNTATLTVAITAVNDNPTIGAVGPITIAEDVAGGTGTITLVVADVETPVGMLTLSATSSNAALVNPGSFAFSANELIITPLPNAFGTANITITVEDADGGENETILALTVTSANDVPQADDDNASTNEDTPVTVSVVANDTDIDGTIAAATVDLVPGTPAIDPTASNAAGGWATNGSGGITYTPAANYTGPASISYRVSDNSGAPSNTATLTVAITATNDVPTIGAVGPITIAEDAVGGTGTITLVVADVETPANVLTLSATSSNAALVNPGSFAFSGNALIITPLPNAFGTANITITVEDADGGEDETILALTVTSVNDVPQADDDNTSTNEDTPVTFTVITNDTDIDGTITAASVDLAPGTAGIQATATNAAGSWATNGSGGITYTPAANYTGPASISYRVSDNSGAPSNTATLTVAITATNDVPAIGPVGPITITEDAVGGTGTITLVVADAETPVGMLTLSATSSNAALVNPGSFAFSGNELIITPLPNAFGTANITITVEDADGGEDETILALTVTSVNDVPQADDDNTSTNEDTPVTFTVITNDTDIDGTIAAATVDLAPGTAGIQATASNAAGTWQTTPAGAITYTPAANYTGPASIGYRISDNGGAPSNTATLTVVITGVNDNPTIGAVAPITIAEDVVGGTGTITLVVADAETPVGTLTLSATSSNPALVNPGSFAFSGNELIITPLPNAFGTANITIRVEDVDGGADETVLALTVTSVNDTPQADDDNTSTNEDTPVTFTVITNDTDIDGTIAAASVDLAPGTAGIQTTATNAAGTWQTTPAGAVTYTPALNYVGPASITYRVNDNNAAPSNTATFSVTISDVDDAPQASNDNTTTNEDVPVSFNVTTNDSDVDGSIDVASVDLDPATAGVQASVTNATGLWETDGSGSVTFTPLLNYNGPASTTYTVDDMNGNTSNAATFSISVTPVNDNPTIGLIGPITIAEDVAGGTGSITLAVSDIETPVGSLSFSGASDNTALVLNSKIVFSGNNVTITPEANQSGIAAITITVNDGSGGSASTILSLTVTGINDAPTITSITNQSTNEDVATSLLTFTVADAETPLGSLTVTATSDTQGLIPDGNIVIATAGTDKTIQITPAANQSGTAIIEIEVSDGVNTASTTFQITVNTVNDIPTITNVADQTINEDAQTTALSFTIDDVETAAGSLVVSTSSSNQTLVPNANIVVAGTGATRTVQVTPVANLSGTAVITLSVSDGPNTAPETFQVIVNAVNDVPTITALTDQTINEDNATLPLSIAVGDLETAVSALTLSGTSNNATLVPDGNIAFTGTGATRMVTVTPAANQFGVAVITVRVNDGTNDTPTSFQVTVNPVNDAPVITGQTPTSTNEEQALTIELTHLTISDVDNVSADFSLTVLSNPNYSFSANTITPNANVTGNMVVRVQVNDGTANSNIYNLQVSVTPVNDAPVVTGQSVLTTLEDNSITIALGNLSISDPDNTTGFTFVLGTGSDYSVSGNVVTPSPHYNGTLSVPVTVSDGALSSIPYNLQIQVTAVNDKPQIAGQIPVSIAEVQPVTIEVSQLTIFDPDNNFPDDFILYVLGGTNYTASGNTVTPTANFSGSLQVRVFVSDGIVNSDFYNFQIQVNSTNDAPVITGYQPLSTPEGQPLTIDFDDLTVNDPDNSYPTGFALTILPGSNYTFSGNTVTFNANINGLIDVTVKVNDGLVDSQPYVIKVSVNGVNDAPDITGQFPLSIPEDGFIMLRLADLQINDPDSPLSGFTMTVSPGINYSLSDHTVTPSPNFYGTLTVPVIVNDGSANSDPYNVQIVVTAVNDAPIITAQNALSTLEDQPITLKLEDFLVTDVDNTYPSGFSLIIQGNGANYTVSGNTITPATNFTGVIGVGLVVNDGATTLPANSNSFNAEITVNSINDAPTLDAINNVTIQEDPLEAVIVSLTNITAGLGEGGQTVGVTASTSKPEWFETFEVIYSGGTTASVRVKPKANVNGTSSITVRVQDNGLESPSPNVNFFERTFDFIIDAVNDAPVFTSQPVTLAELDQAFEYIIVATDVEGEVITITAPTIPAWLTLTQTSNGNAILSGTPPSGTTGQVPVVIEAKDPATTSATSQQFSIFVNARPVINAFVVSTNEDATYIFESEFANNYADADGNPIVEIQIKQLPAKGSLILNETLVAVNGEGAGGVGRLGGVGVADSTGTDTIKWNASDGVYYSSTDSNLSIVIIPVNDPPEILAIEPPESDTLKYELGSQIPIQLTKLFDARDADGDDIVAAEIGFTTPQEYRDMQDKFLFKDTLGIVGNFNETFGILTLTGKAPVKDYVAAIRAIKYNYIAIDNFELENRLVSIKLSDGVFGQTKERLVGLIYNYVEIDIANAFTPTGNNPYWNIYSPNGLGRYKDALIQVFNKRGTLVYEATGFGNKWNGSGPDGNALPPDSYYYTIDLKYDKKKYKGVVTILR